MKLCIGLRHYDDVPNIAFVFDMDTTCKATMEQDLVSGAVKLHVPKTWKAQLSRFSCSSDSLAAQPIVDDNSECKETPAEAPPKRKIATTKKASKRLCLKRRLTEDENLEEEEETVLYNAQKDVEQCIQKDHVLLEQKHDMRKDYLYFDKDGTELKEDDETIEFIVTPQGEVVCPNGVDYAMFAFLDDEGRTRYAPGKPLSFEFSKTDVMINIRWLNTDDDVTSSHPNPLSVDEIQLQDEYVLPLASFCVNLSHMLDKIREKWMPAYASTLRLYDKFCCKPRLGSYRVQPHKDDLCIADTMDLLEFRFIQSQWIWRSTLGSYIWNQFLLSVVDFGGKWNIELVETLLNSEYFYESPMTNNRTTCEACGKQDIVENSVSFGSSTLVVGYVCMNRMQYIFDIGSCMRQARAINDSFSKEKLTKMILNMQTLQANYLAL